jgi:hypothetical protein
VPEDGHIKEQEEIEMEAIALIGMLVVGFAILGAFAAALGADSRPWINDEWRRLY